MSFPSSNPPRTLLGFCLSAFMAAALFAACAPPDPVIHASDYNQQCNSAAECVPVTEGQISCCGLDCNNNAAIHKDELARYKEDLQDRAPSCGGVLCPAIACGPGLATCINGMCRGAKSCGDPLNPVPCK